MNDILILVDPSVENIRLNKAILWGFVFTSSFRINFGMSSFIGVNVDLVFYLASDFL